MVRKYALLVIAVIALFGLLGWSVYAQKQKPGKVVWEYKEAISLSEQQVNSLGADGWEMVGLSVDSSNNKFMYFKRVK